MNHKTAKIFGFIFPAILIAVMFFNIFLPDKKFSAEEVLAAFLAEDLKQRQNHMLQISLC